MSALTLAAKLAGVPSCPLGDRHPGTVSWTHEAGPSSSSSRQPASARLLQQRQGASVTGEPQHHNPAVTAGIAFVCHVSPCVLHLRCPLYGPEQQELCKGQRSCHKQCFAHIPWPQFLGKGQAMQALIAHQHRLSWNVVQEDPIIRMRCTWSMEESQCQGLCRCGIYRQGTARGACRGFRHTSAAPRRCLRRANSGSSQSRTPSPRKLSWPATKPTERVPQVSGRLSAVIRAILGNGGAGEAGGSIGGSSAVPPVPLHPPVRAEIAVWPLWDVWWCYAAV